MNTNQQAGSAYAAATRPIRTPRRIEYEAIASITSRIVAAARDGKKGFPALVAALHENHQLWTILACNVADGDNALSKDLRARIFYLAEFTFQHTKKILSGDATADILVEINSAVMGGLRSERAAA